jgi:hypothetical protein
MLSGFVSLSFEFQPVADQPGADQFPESTHVLTDDQGSFFQYFTYSSDTASINGNVIEVFGDLFTTRFPDPIKLFEFPLVFDTSFEDIYTLNDGVAGQIISKTEVANSIDAYGTLELPSMSFDEVLRIKRDQTISNYTYDPEGNPLDTTFSSAVQYDYVAAGYPYPLAIISIVQGDTGVTFLTDLATGLVEPELSEEVKIFPNPGVAGEFRFESNHPVVRVRVFDLSGKSVAQFDRSARRTDRGYIDLRHLNAGTYIIEFSGDGFFHSQKLMILK